MKNPQREVRWLEAEGFAYGAQGIAPEAALSEIEGSCWGREPTVPGCGARPEFWLLAASALSERQNASASTRWRSVCTGSVANAQAPR